MDPITLLLLIIVILALGSWGYGSYTVRPGPGVTEPVGGPAPWVNPIGAIGLLLLIVLLVVLFTGFRFGVGGPVP